MQYTILPAAAIFGGGWIAAPPRALAVAVITVAANTSGGVCGKMISPQSLAVSTAAVGLVGRESDIFRFTFKHSIILTTVIAVMAYGHTTFLKFLVPVYEKGAAAAKAAPPSVKEGMVWLAIFVGSAVVLAAVAIAVGRGQREEASAKAEAA